MGWNQFAIALKLVPLRSLLVLAVLVALLVVRLEVASAALLEEGRQQALSELREVPSAALPLLPESEPPAALPLLPESEEERPVHQGLVAYLVSWQREVRALFRLYTAEMLLEVPRLPASFWQQGAHREVVYGDRAEALAGGSILS